MLTDAMSERLRRALDRRGCVASVLQAMRCAADGCESADVADTSRCAIEELAARWPQDYPTDAVERLVIERKDRAELGLWCCDNSNEHLGRAAHCGGGRSQ